MSEYLNDNVFLTSKTAQNLFHEVAKNLPIIDFHTHLPQKEILTNRTFNNIWELWLEHDHYKWRLMRGCGVDEKFITGSASPKEKFIAFASIMPLAIGNPVHHWAHFELKRVFGINALLNEDTAEEIWEQTLEQLSTQDDLSVHGLLKSFKVELICTTDDPVDCLTDHQKANELNTGTKVYPTFRPDKADISFGKKHLVEWTESLSKASGIEVNSFKSLLAALENRHTYFHQYGCRLSDHGLAFMPYSETTEQELETAYNACLNGEKISEKQALAFKYAILKNVAKWNNEKSWTMQLHLGPLRNANEKMSQITGRDSGYDTMGSYEQTSTLIQALNDFEQNNILGKTIVYNLSPTESESICCALQNFQNSKAKGLIQYGPAWWHLDHVRGIVEQIDILTSLGAIGTSVGMLTDSRSFTSYVRHEYYRRLLCQYIGDAAEKGEIPNDSAALKKLISDICYTNPLEYFGWS